MYHHAITEQNFADLLDEVEVRERRDVAGTLVVAGVSPRFGAVMLMQTFEAITLLSEIAFHDDVDALLAAQGDMLREQVARWFAGLR